MGATVTNLGPAPRTVIDIGSQFETYSSLADRSTIRPRNSFIQERKSSRNKRSYAETTIAASDGNIYYSGSSTDNSTTYEVFVEDELDLDEHDGMNYHLILNQKNDDDKVSDEPQFQQSM